MANGDAAAAAGMDTVPGTASVRDSYDEHNKTRDYLAARTNAVTPIAKGGTGATDATAARTALGISAANTPSGVGSNVQTDLDNLNATKLTRTAAQYGDDFTSRDIDISNRVSKGGDTMSGHLYLPNSSAATSNYTVCYINGDGRVSRGASSQRYKKFIHDAPDLGDLFAAPLREYQMKADGLAPADPTKRIGYIAEELAGTDMERFVVVINDQVESIDFIALLLAQVASLNARVSALESGA
jgi:hypothetical protein